MHLSSVIIYKFKPIYCSRHWTTRIDNDSVCSTIHDL